MDRSVFTQNAQTALKLAEKAAKTLSQGYIGTEHLLLGLIREGNGVAASVLRDNGVDEDKIEELIRDFVAPEDGVVLKERRGYSKSAIDVLEESDRLTQKYRSQYIGTEHILMAIVKIGDNVASRLLNTVEVSQKKIYMDLLVAMGLDEYHIKEDLSRNMGKKKDHSMLNQYSRDLTQMAREGKLDPVIGRDDEILRVIQILSRRTKNNPCLVGEPGVGKTAIVEGLAQRIVEGNVPETVRNKRVLTLDLSGMVAGSKYRGEFEERIKKLIKEVIASQDVLLFLDEIHTLIGAGGAEGAIDAANILKPSMARGEIQLIGATTLDEYRKHIEKDTALERRFQPVTVEESTMEETYAILRELRPKYEEHHGTKITDEALMAAVKLSERYINDRNLPDKAIDLIDEASSAAHIGNIAVPEKLTAREAAIHELDDELEQAFKTGDFNAAGELKRKQDELIKKYHSEKARFEKQKEKKKMTVDENSIANVVSVWTHIPVNKLEEKESAKLLKLESILHKRVVGQNEAVEAVSRAMRRGRVGLQDPKRPIGSFLFLGPTGVGKTELSKALAETMFGKEDALIRVDMSEFMESHSVSKLIGAPPGYVGFDDGGQLCEKVRRNPYSVVLFDEIEKAHPDIFNVLLQVLDDGHITDSQGRKISFKNTVIIMTSNAGAARIMEPKNLGFMQQNDEKRDYLHMKEGVMDEVKRIFKPEFINRIDDIIVFHPLNKKDMKDIMTLLSKDLIQRCSKLMDIKLTITPAVKNAIVDKYTNEKMGARPLKRAIQSEIEDALAEEILKNHVKKGDHVTVRYTDKKIVFDVAQ